MPIRTFEFLNSKDLIAEKIFSEINILVGSILEKNLFLDFTSLILQPINSRLLSICGESIVTLVFLANSLAMSYQYKPVEFISSSLYFFF